jgi:hypothetical protein
MEQQNYTLEQAAEKFGKPHKIFDIQIGDRLYPVYSIEGYEHNLGKWNGCPDTWWLDYSVYHSDNDDEVPTMRELIPYIDTGVHRVCWEINYRQFNSTKYKWDEWSIRNGGICTIKANGKEVYKFHWRDLGGALAEAHSLISKISEHPFNFINPEKEIGRKIWYYGLPATILLGYEPGEIRINPDLSYMTSDEWWNELEKRKSNVKPPNSTQNEDDLLDAEHFAEHKDYGSINHGSVFYDGMINWFRHEKKDDE